MTSGLVNASFSLPEWQAVKMVFFAPCYYTINRNKYYVYLHALKSHFTPTSSTPPSSPYFHYFSPLQYPTTLPPPPPNCHIHSHNPLHSFSTRVPVSLTLPQTTNTTATPPYLLVTNNNITLSPSLIYQLSLHVGITDPCQYNSCNCHYNIADITLLPPPQCISNLIT